MKHQLMTLGLAFASIGLFATSVGAQEYRIVTKIPFDFTVRETTCPAGVYDLQAQSLANFEALHNTSGKCSLFISSRRYLRDKAAGHPRLVFRRYGQSYFLSRIWNGQGTGSAVAPGSREKHLQEATSPAEIATTVVDGVVGQ
jgi:hypothetical protein